MSYTALARKWRPKKFAELVGQEHVRRALVNALETGRVHHAFLFTGTRGVGKTTIARIFAKCLNCEIGVTPEPCGVCAACKEIDSGRFVDLIEVDAASRTKVDDTRELLDNVQYAPTRGRYKVYLIDEVHMLSTHSFNALLKTLEEPPPHVKFLLATTDPQKLPVTVLSRCLQFNLKRMPVGQIAEHMKLLLEKEGVPFEASGLRLVAQAADGSMRDGLSLLDQLIAFGGGKAGEDEARAMLGTISRDHVERLAELLATLNVPELMKCASSLEEFAPDYAQVLDELAGLLVRVAMKQTVSDFEGDDLYAPELLERLAKALAPEDIQLFYQTAITGRRDLGLAPDPRTGFEMTLLRMIAFRPANDAGVSQGSGTGSAAGRGGAAAAAQAAAGGGANGASGGASAAGGGAAAAARAAALGSAASSRAGGAPSGGVGGGASGGSAGGVSGASGGGMSGGVAAGTGAGGGPRGANTDSSAAAGTGVGAGSGPGGAGGAAASTARAAALAAARGGTPAAGSGGSRGAPAANGGAGGQREAGNTGAGLGTGSGISTGAGAGAGAGIAAGSPPPSDTAPGSGSQRSGAVSGGVAQRTASASGYPGQREGAAAGKGASGGRPSDADAEAEWLSLQNAEGDSSEDPTLTGDARGGTSVEGGPTNSGPTNGARGGGGSTGGARAGSGSTSGAGGGSGSASGASSSHGASSSSGTSGGADSPEGSWASIMNQLELGGAARQLASHCVLVGRQPGIVRLAIDPRVKFVRTTSQEEKLAQALSHFYGETVRLEFTTASGEAVTPAQAEQRASQQELEAARQAFETDPGVQGLRERFGATLLPNTIRPVK
jgi:DNA polymerase-3 subunit gamma/tau